MSIRTVPYPLLLLLLISSALSACDSCRTSGGDPSRGGAAGLTAGSSAEQFKWSADVTYHYKNWSRDNAAHALAVNDTRGRHTHGLIDEWTSTVRIGYAVTKDLELGLAQGYRQVRGINVGDPLLLGQHDTLRGFDDLRFDLSWRFKKQESGRFPVDLALFGEAKFPTGMTNERIHGGAWAEAEHQPGTGSWDGTLGVAVSRGWQRWGASGAAAYTYKTEGTQDFRAGDVLRLSASGSYRVSPENWGTKIWLNLGAQAILERKAFEDGQKDSNHGGQTLFLIPGLAVQPLERLTFSAGVYVPVYQELNGYHQREDWSGTAGVRIRF
ncbi:MAG: hypothetical protein L6R28_09135 [Planctomycetes bacterium]|nr:hypothetical protein [Planctomycetota bacterium]